MIREVIPEKEDIWHFGPFLFLSIPEWLWKLDAIWKEELGDVAAVCLCRARRSRRSSLRPRFRSNWLFAFHPSNWGYMLLVVLSSVMCVAMAIKIWNNTRIEMNLEQNQQLLLKARMDALTEPDQSAFSFQHAEYGFVADSLRSGHGARRGAEAFQYSAAPAAQARDVCAAARGARLHRRLSRYRSDPLRPRQAANLQGNRRGSARRLRSQHAAAADGRKLD